MKVTVGGWAIFECEDCGGQFAALTVPDAKIFRANCAKRDAVPGGTELASGISLDKVTACTCPEP